MSESPLVSVVLPVKDGVRFLREAISSVLDQSYRPLELLVVDGGSTDGSRDVAEEFVGRGVRVIDQEGTGIASAWNQGIEAAEGPILAFLSSDDRWTNGKLDMQVSAMIEQPDVAYTIGHFRYFLEPGCEIPATFNRSLLGRDLVGRIMETLVARREAFDLIGLFDAGLRTAEDVDWYARAKDRDVPMRLLSDVLLEKRVHDLNISASGAQNTPHLMEALRRSILRRRESES